MARATESGVTKTTSGISKRRDSGTHIEFAGKQQRRFKGDRLGRSRRFCGSTSVTNYWI